jgi:hypothetical protein
LFKTQKVDIISIDIKEIKITIIVKKFSIEEIKPTDFCYVFQNCYFSLVTIKRLMSRDHAEQDGWFFERNLIAEYNNEPTGILSLRFPGDPDPQ